MSSVYQERYKAFPDFEEQKIRISEPFPNTWFPSWPDMPLEKRRRFPKSRDTDPSLFSRDPSYRYPQPLHQGFKVNSACPITFVKHHRSLP